MTREAQRKLRLASRVRQSKITVVATILVIGALVAVSVVVAGPHSHPFAPPPRPGDESPAGAVAGYTTALFTRHPAVACRYTAPSERAACTDTLSVMAPLAQMTGSWTIGHTAISGSRAIVDVEYRATGYDGRVSMDNTDPNAGLPDAAMSFDAAYRQVFTSQYIQYGTDCVLVGGLWYVDDVQYDG